MRLKRPRPRARPLWVCSFVFPGLLLFAIVAPLSEGRAAAALSDGEETVESMAREKLHHVPDGTFRNPRTEGKMKSFFQLLKWKFSRNRWKEEKKRGVSFPVSKPDFEALEGSGGDYFVWLGHSTVYMKVGGVRLITDPVFWDAAFGVKRVTLFPIDPADIPGVDYVLISHGHYDHLDTKTVVFLRDRFDPVFISGPGYEKYFDSLGIRSLSPIDWGKSVDVGGVIITALPVQHWSRRTPFDTNRMLWSSFMVEGGGKKYYWVGDTGYFRGFKEVGERFGPIDFLFVPIGSYEPRWFMKAYHVNPEEAMRVALDVKARRFVPIHWGTFDLTDEPLTQPVERIKAAAVEKEEGGGPELLLLDHGGAVVAAAGGDDKE